MIVCPSLVKGSVKIIHGTLEGTIPLFEECFNFFQKYPWLDKYRYFFFLNPNDISYREASLDNIANAYVDAGQKQKAIETYEKMIELFPENYIAPFYLKFLK